MSVPFVPMTPVMSGLSSHKKSMMNNYYYDNNGLLHAFGKNAWLKKNDPQIHYIKNQ